MGRKKTEPSAIPLSPRKLIARKVALWGTVAALGCTAIGVGFNRLERYVEVKYATPSVPPKVVLKNRPAWMNDYLADRIAAVARPGGRSSAFDRSLLADVHDQLMSSADVAPWIESIKEIRRVYGGTAADTVEVDATYRAPIALVHWKEDYWLVDSKGIMLPERFSAEQVPKVVIGRDGKLVIRVIDGVRNAPPSPGESWRGTDLAAGLELLRLIHDKSFSNEIVKVDVNNFAGRISPSAAQLTLVTRYNTEIRWGSMKDTVAEIKAGRKLETLEHITAQFGQVDAKHPWIDIRFDKVIHPTPAAPSADAATTAAAR